VDSGFLILHQIPVHPNNLRTHAHVYLLFSNETFI
jgi:hypothetical protein